MADYFIAKLKIEGDGPVHLVAFKKDGTTLTDLVLVGIADFGSTKAVQEVAKYINSFEKKGIFVTYTGPEGVYTSKDADSHGQIVKLSDDEIEEYHKKLMAALGRTDTTDIREDDWIIK